MADSTSKPTAADFFAGSGLVTEALKRWFDVVWANDICADNVFGPHDDAGHGIGSGQ